MWHQLYIFIKQRLAEADGILFNPLRQVLFVTETENTVKAMVSIPAWKAKQVRIDSMIIRRAEVIVSERLTSFTGKFFQLL